MSAINMDQGKYKVVRNKKGKKTTWVFVFQKYVKFRKFSIGHFTKHKSLISEDAALCGDPVFRTMYLIN